MSADPVGVSSPAVVQRWKRFGHDRAYVKIGDRDLGYRDLVSGEVHCGHSDDIDVVSRATADLLNRVESVRRATDYVPKHATTDSVSAATEVEARQPSVAEPAIAEPAVAAVLGIDPADVDLAKAEVGTRPATSGPISDRDLALHVPGQAARAKALELRDAAPVRTLFARFVGAKTDERAYRIGADGESVVARRLQRLGPEWRVLHAVPVGERGSDIDHVVIGPGGVFTVNAKNHPQANVWVGGDVVKVNGYSQPYVRNSRYEAKRAEALLSAAAGFDVDVEGIVAVTGAQRGFTVRDQPRDGKVSVMTRKQLDGYLLAVPIVLGQPSIDRIYEVARHLATWQPSVVSPADFT